MEHNDDEEEKDILSQTVTEQEKWLIHYSANAKRHTKDQVDKHTHSRYRHHSAGVCSQSFLLSAKYDEIKMKFVILVTKRARK